MKIFLTFVVLALTGTCFVADAAVEADASKEPQKECGTITVAAASDLTDAMNEIARNFEKATGCTVRVSTGSS
jgi:ABC-type molybdate transport system substrate-binding protein